MNVYAEYFHEKNYIDERAYRTYKTIAEYFSSAIPVPDIVIYCRASLETLQKRIRDRRRGSDLRYPSNHIRDIYRLYGTWVESYDSGYLYVADGEEFDWRKPDVLRAIASGVLDCLDHAHKMPGQLYLFEAESSKEYKNSGNILKLLREPAVGAGKDGERTVLIMHGVQHGQKYPVAYIAAPFTGRAEVGDNPITQGTLFEVPPLHGEISKGEYREALNGISKLLKKMGVSAILPHRDINKWGKKKLAPETVVEQCSKQVEECDVFIGILGESHGSHYEFGLAVAKKKPAIMIRCDAIKQSFISEGIEGLEGNILVLRCKNVEDIPKILGCGEVRTFLKCFIPISDR